MDRAAYFVKPFFKYWDHHDMVPASVELLKNDGREQVFRLLNRRYPATGKRYMTLLARGARDADLPWSCGYILHTFHFHHPWTHRGYLTCASAGDILARLFTRGQDMWTLGRRDRAIYQLGRMLHLVQDVFIPHHAAVTARNGHGQFEEWLSENWRHYLVDRGGQYAWERTFGHAGGDVHTVSSQNPYDWIDAGSHVSIEWYRAYFQDRKCLDSQLFLPLAAELVPHMLAYSAGFINRFFTGLTV